MKIKRQYLITVFPISFNKATKISLKNISTPIKSSQCELSAKINKSSDIIKINNTFSYMNNYHRYLITGTLLFIFNYTVAPGEVSYYYITLKFEEQQLCS